MCNKGFSYKTRKLTFFLTYIPIFVIKISILRREEVLSR